MNSVGKVRGAYGMVLAARRGAEHAMGIDHQTVIIFPDEEDETGSFTAGIRELAAAHAAGEWRHGSAQRLLDQVARQLAAPAGEMREIGPPVFSSGARIGWRVPLMLTCTDEAPVPPLLPFLFDVLTLANRRFMPDEPGGYDQIRTTILHSSDPADLHPWHTVVEAFLDGRAETRLCLHWIAGGDPLPWPGDAKWNDTPAAVLAPLSRLAVVDAACFEMTD